MYCRCSSHLGALSLFPESRKRSNALFWHISGRKTGLHFSWKCSNSLFCAFPNGKPGPTFPGNALKGAAP
ncbi:hypothetical protein B0909_26625 [Rhizobium rhizogenes]|nr:hypothetical protein B0909_26625 [Rhizobium rhizogenes]